MVKSLKSEKLDHLTNIRHAFMTRQGGVSTGLFDSLNAALGKEDRPEDVHENRTRIANHIGGDVKNLVTARQIHSNKVIVVTEPWDHADRLEGDALVTTQPNLIVGVITADCVPILLADDNAGVVAAVHAGWRGAVTGIIQNTVETMVDLGATRPKITAGIGPCIWQNSYEVDQQFYDGLPDDSDLFIPSKKADHWMFDLPNFVLRALNESGITSVTPSPADTYTNEQDFFSNRRRFHRDEPHFGCMMSCIMRV